MLRNLPLKMWMTSVAAFLFAASASVLASAPNWWEADQTQILNEDASKADYAPINLGQLKHVAEQAKKHLDRHLPGGSGAAITSLVEGFEPRADHTYLPAELDAMIADNYAPATIGQLKAVAQPFYERLIAASYDTKANLIAQGYPADWDKLFPWDPEAQDEQLEANYSMATIGQLKMVFSFDLSSRPLTAVDLTIAMNEDTSREIPLQSTGGGDGFVEIAIVREPASGTVTLQKSVATYIPHADFSGTDSFAFRVTKSGVNDDGEVSLTVNPINDPPTVNAGNNMVTVRSVPAILRGTITDIDTPPGSMNIQWQVMSGPGPVTFENPNELEASASFRNLGNYVLRLSANDGDHTREDSLTVTVRPGANIPPTVALTSPARNAIFEQNTPVALQASALAAAGGTIAKVEFYDGARKIAEDSSPSSDAFEAVWIPHRFGVFRLRAKATDSNGQIARSTAVIVRVPRAPRASRSSLLDVRSEFLWPQW